MLYPLLICGVGVVSSVVGMFFIRLGASQNIMGALYKGLIATGVIAIMADMLGYEAYGIELDRELVAVARDLARRHGSGARFAVGSFLPAGYRYRPRDGDGRLGTIGRGPSGYGELGHALDDFDVVYAYPWSGEEPVMRDVMRAYGAPHARLILHDVEGDASSPASPA